MDDENGGAGMTRADAVAGAPDDGSGEIPGQATGETTVMWELEFGLFLEEVPTPLSDPHPEAQP
jgi:hypothetical protein